MKKIGIWVIVFVVLGGLFGSTIVLNMDTIRDNAPNDIEAAILKDDLATFGVLVHTYGAYFAGADVIQVAQEGTRLAVSAYYIGADDSLDIEFYDFGTLDGARKAYNLLDSFHDYEDIPDYTKPVEVVLGTLWDILEGIYRAIQMIGSIIGMVIVLLFDSFAVVWELIQYCFALLGV